MTYRIFTQRNFDDIENNKISVETMTQSVHVARQAVLEFLYKNMGDYFSVILALDDKEVIKINMEYVVFEECKLCDSHIPFKPFIDDVCLNCKIKSI